MPKPIFQFRLRSDATTYYYVDAGAVATSTTAVNLTKSFPDWNKLKMQWTRSMEYLGMIRMYSPEAAQFVKDAAIILRYLFNTQGDTEAVCELEVLKLNTTDQLYYPRGLCSINFGKYSDAELFVNAALIEGGLTAKVKAYGGTDFAIPIGEPGVDPDSDYVWISGDPPGSDPGGVMLLGKYNYQTLKSGSTLIDVGPGTGAGLVNNQCLGTVFINQEGAYAVLTPGSPLTGNGIGYGSPFDSAWSAKAIQAFTGTLTGSVHIDSIENLVSSDQNVKLEIWAMVYNYGWGSPGSVGSFITEYPLWADPGGDLTPGSSRLSLAATFAPATHPFAEGDVMIIALRAICGVAATSTNLSVQLGSDPAAITLEFQFRQPDSPCRALTQYELFRKLFHKLTGSTAVDPVSDLLTTDVYPGPDVYNVNPVNTFVTCGDALRQLYVSPDLTNVDPQIKTSLKAFNKDIYASLGAGIGVELDGSGNEVLRLEKLEYFFQKDVLIKDLGRVNKFRKTPFLEFKANNIKAGYADQTYDEVNGRSEWNSSITYQTPVKSVIKEADNECAYRTDCYGIEYTRANLANKTTTDSESDNDTFKIQSNGNTLAIPGLSPDPYGVDKAQTVTAGLTTDVWPTVYNMPFSPARNAGRMLPWLKSIYYNLATPILTFGTGKKNTSIVSSMYTGPTVTENADVDLTPDGTGDDIIFKPWVFEFEAVVPIDLAELMEANPYGVFGFTVRRGNTDYYLEGFVLDCGITDGTNETYNFKLLCSPNTVMPDYL